LFVNYNYGLIEVRVQRGTGQSPFIKFKQRLEKQLWLSEGLERSIPNKLSLFPEDMTFFNSEAKINPNPIAIGSNIRNPKSKDKSEIESR